MTELHTIPTATRYKASETGEIYDTKLGRNLLQCLNGKPQYRYCRINFDDGTTKLTRVHRLIALTFCDKPDGCEFVDHINRDKLDNRASNLRWVDRKTNNRNLDKSVYVNYLGERKLLVEVCEDVYGQGYQTAYTYLYMAVFRDGLTLEGAMVKYANKGHNKTGTKTIFYTIDGVTKDRAGWLEHIGLSQSTVYRHMKIHSVSFDVAVQTIKGKVAA